MAVQSSGQIAISDIATEFGGSQPHGLSEYYGEGGVTSSGQIKFSDFYGTSSITASDFIADLASPTYRNYLESNSDSSGKASYSFINSYADDFYDNLANTHVSSAAPQISVAWGAIPSDWSGLTGSTILFYNYAQTVSNVTNAFLRDSSGTTRSLSLTHYLDEDDISTGDIRVGYASNSSSNFNLNNAIIGGTFNKSTANSDEFQTIFALPGVWSVVTTGSIGNVTPATVTAQAHDIVILFSSFAANGRYNHEYRTTTNLTRRGGQRRMWAVNRNNNLSLWSVDSGASNFQIEGSHVDVGTSVSYIVLRSSI